MTPRADRTGTLVYPLNWPAGWPRTPDADRTYALFGRASNAMPCTVHRGVQGILEELGRIRGVAADQAVVTTNLRVRNDGIPLSGQKPIRDPGAALYFKLHDAERVLACDKWNKLEYNLHAIVLHIRALRGQERWGVGTMAQAFQGFVAIEANASRPWREVLEMQPFEKNPSTVMSRYRELLKRAHTDTGGAGDADVIAELQRARDQGLAELGG